MAKRKHHESHEHGDEHEAHEHHDASAESSFSPGFLRGLVIALGILVVASAFLLGYLVGGLNGGDGSTTTTGGAGTTLGSGKYVAAPDGAPKVELFIMSYCPYGLQMQKAYIQAADLLQGKADFKIRWVSYAMHGLTEVQENLRQYCIQKEEPAKYSAYTRCFVESTDANACVAAAKVDSAKLATCMDASDKEFGIMASYNDQASWLSGRFPQFNIDKALNTQYGVQGSPTMVINGQQASVQRSAEAVKTAVCNAFGANKPAECNTALSATAEQPGKGAIGAGSGAATATGQC